MTDGPVSIERETKKGFLERFQQINVIRRTRKQSDHRVGLYASESPTEHTVDVQFGAKATALLPSLLTQPTRYNAEIVTTETPSERYSSSNT